MVWYRFRAQGARNVAGAVVTTGLGKFYATTDTTFSSPVPTRRVVDASNNPVAVGSGATLTNIAVNSGVTEEFDADLPGPEGYWKSGSSPAVSLISATGALAAVTAAQAGLASAQTAVNTASTAATNAAADAQAARAELDARPGSGHIVLPTEGTAVPSGLPENTIIVVLGA